MRVRLGWFLGAAALFLASGCGAEQFAKVKIESNPPSAEVYLGTSKEVHDTTPCTVLFDSEGEYELFLKKPGYLAVKKRVLILEKEVEGGAPRLVPEPKQMVVTLDPVEDPGSKEPPPPDKPYYDD